MRLKLRTCAIGLALFSVAAWNTTLSQEPDEAAASRVWVVPVRGAINKLTYDFVNRSLKEAEASGAEVFVLDMHTPGGLVDSALDICAALKSSKLRTVCWVHTDAISAGAMIALACDEIVVSDHSSLGDCAPIMVGPQGVVDVGEEYQAKIESRILAEFRDSSVTRGYPLALCMAMVRLGPAVYKITRNDPQQTLYVDSTELRGYGLKDASTPNDNGESDPMDQGWVIERKVLGADELLTLIADEALEYGFAKARVSSEEDLASYLAVSPGDYVRVRMNTSERVVEFLTSPLVRGLLLMVLVLTFYAEMQAPGLGVMGATAAACLLVLLGAPYLTGMTNLVEIGIILLGFVLLAVEVFLLPGFGVAGVLGLIAIAVGLVLTFVPPESGPGWWPALQGTWDAALLGLTVVVASLSLSIVGIGLLTRYFGAIPALRKLEVAPPTLVSLQGQPMIFEGHAIHIGDEGVVTSILRPVGRAEFGPVTVDVLTRGEMITPGNRIRVVESQGNRIVVEPA